MIAVRRTAAASPSPAAPVEGCEFLTDASLKALRRDARWGVSHKVYQQIDDATVILLWCTGRRWRRWGWDSLRADDHEWLGAGWARSVRQARRRAVKVRRLAYPAPERADDGGPDG